LLDYFGACLCVGRGLCRSSLPHVRAGMANLMDSLNGGAWSQPKAPPPLPSAPPRVPNGKQRQMVPEPQVPEPQVPEPEVEDEEEPVVPTFSQPPVHLRRVTMSSDDYAKELEEQKKHATKKKETRPADGTGSHGLFSDARTIFPDAEEMKMKVREALMEPSYNVFDFYHETGHFQRIAKSTAFENVTLLVIGLNAIWIAIDTDTNGAPTLMEADLHFQIADNAFCGYFFVEWVIRFGAFANKCNCRKDAWFVFDSLLVVMMVAETWVLTAVILLTSAGGQGIEISGSNSLRLFRLLRLSRMARMLRSMPELMILIKGMAAATRSVFSVMCLLIIIMYVFAIAFKQLADGTVMGQYYFPTVQHSMYTLLIYGTFLDDLAPFCDEVGAESAACLALVMVFVLLAACTVLNMLIGVLCEVVTAVAETEKEEVLVSFVTTKLQSLLNSLDADHDGHISQDEFMKILGLPEAAGALEEVGVDPVDIVDYMDFIFQQRQGPMPFPKFMEVILNLRQTNQCTIGDIVDLRKFVQHQCSCAETVLYNHFGHAPRRAVGSLSQTTSPQWSPSASKEAPVPEFGRQISRGQGRIKLDDLQARTGRLEEMMQETLSQVRALLDRVPEEGGDLAEDSTPVASSNSPTNSQKYSCPNCNAKMLPKAQVLRSSSSPKRGQMSQMDRRRYQDRHHDSRGGFKGGRPEELT